LGARGQAGVRHDVPAAAAAARRRAGSGDMRERAAECRVDSNACMDVCMGVCADAWMWWDGGATGKAHRELCHHTLRTPAPSTAAGSPLPRPFSSCPPLLKSAEVAAAAAVSTRTAHHAAPHRAQPTRALVGL
jgi:hypothetical protein